MKRLSCLSLFLSGCLLEAPSAPLFVADDTGMAPVGDAGAFDTGRPDVMFTDTGRPDRPDAQVVPDAVVRSDAEVQADAAAADVSEARDVEPMDSGMLADAEPTIDTSFQPDADEPRDASVADIGQVPDAGVSDAAVADALPADVGFLTGFALIPAGTFVMGSSPNELGAETFEGPQHPVTITRPFWMQITEVTQGEYRSLMGVNPSAFVNCGDNCPVENVNWNDAVAFANVRSWQEGLLACYQFSPARQVWELVSLDCAGYRLPTEAEWEYAARAGTTTAFSSGGITQIGCAMVDPNLDRVGWYCFNALGVPHIVADKPANPWGLRDMHGNVQEWVDTCNEMYLAGARTDPVGPPGPCDKLNRGGAWEREAEFARSASRNWSPPFRRASQLGFRLARTAR